MTASVFSPMDCSQTSHLMIVHGCQNHLDASEADVQVNSTVGLGQHMTELVGDN